MIMTRWQTALALAFSDGIPRRAFIVALIIGSILNLINQGDALIAGRALDWLKIALTYIVPYCVNTHGAVSARLGERARLS
jgi:hypothetical protein